jgi:hypothetical protein
MQELNDGLQTERDSFNLGLYQPSKSFFSFYAKKNLKKILL